MVERCPNRLKQWRAVATRYDKRAANYRAGVAALLLWLEPVIRRHAGSMQVPSVRWLDLCIAVRPSPIDGLGLFAVDVWRSPAS